MELTIIQKIAIWVVPVVFAISLHEAAHAWMANRKGDATAKLLGRLSFNPIKHIDPVGTIVVPAIMLATMGIAFGWAKPVPIDARNFKNPRKDMMWVAAAGPMSNLLMTLFWALVLKFAAVFGDPHSIITAFIVFSATAGILINTILMVLNMLPVPPLDGSRIVSGFLSPAAAIQYNKIETYGLFILIGLMVTGILGKIISPFIVFIFSMLSFISGIDQYTFYAFINMIQ